MQLTDELANNTKEALITGFANLIAVQRSDIVDAPEARAILHRIFSPVETGGVGFADPTAQGC